MKNRIFAVLLVISLLMTTTLTARTVNDGLCMHTQSVVQYMTSSTLAETVCLAVCPVNHNLQETARTIEKTHEIGNSADWQHLTEHSKRSIYVGEADRCRFGRINI